MKRITLYGFFFFLFTTTSYARDPLRFAQIIDTPDQMVGAKILTIAYKRLDIPVKIIVMPGKRALVESSKGRVDGEVHRIFRIGKDYPALIRVPTAINYIEPSVFAKSNKIKVTGCAGLRDFRIGIVRGVRHAEACTESMKRVQVVGDSSKLMQILDKSRVDLVVTARLNGLIQLKRLNLNSIYPLSPPLSKKLVYHYLHEKHKDLVPKIDTVFKEMQDSGELEKLRDKYIKELLE